MRAAREIRPIAMVMSAPPAVDPVTLELRVLSEVLRRNDIVGEKYADAMSYLRLYFAIARFPEFFDALRQEAESAKETSWFDLVPIPEQPEDLLWWGANAAFDPTNDLSAYKGPVFAAYGLNDKIAPSDLNGLRLKQLIEAGGGSVTLLIADEADHRLEMPGKMVDGQLRFPQLAPEYLKGVTDFLAEHLHKDP